MNRLIVAVLLLSLFSLPAFSQRADTAVAVMINDTVFKLADGDYMVADTFQVTPKKVKSPTKALMFALVLPGLGQTYNGKYYKIPIVWAALGVAGYAIVFNTNQYRDATINYILDESPTNKRYLDGWKRRMELSYIGAIVVYGLQILDAYVDANLSTWDVNENLSLGISPSLQPMMAPSSKTGYSGGLTCSLKIRGR